VTLERSKEALPRVDDRPANPVGIDRTSQSAEKL
jgi:hypothetical protein